MSVGIKLIPMSRELFEAAAYQVAISSANKSVATDALVLQLDSDQFWDDTPRTFEQKLRYVEQELQALRDGDEQRVYVRLTKSGRVDLRSFMVRKASKR